MYQIASASVNYVTTPLTNGTWTQLTLTDQSGVALNPNALPKDVNKLKVADSSGTKTAIGIGKTGQVSVVTQIASLLPNQTDDLDLMLNAGMSLFIMPFESAVVASEGRLDITFLKGKRG